MEHHSIVIVGAGLGGLTAARVLSLHDVPVTVYDPGAPEPGGMLDVHPDTGLAALRAAGLDEAFRALVRPGGDTVRILGRDATVHHVEHHDRPEVHRRDLRALLIGALPDGVVRWGATVTDAQPLGGGRHELTVTGGARVSTDLLVGADGPWSRVRPLVSDAVPEYTGLSYVDLRLDHAGTRHPEAAAAIGDGLMIALGDGNAIIGHRDPGDSLHVYAVTRGAPGAFRADAFAGWHPALRALLSGADGPRVARPIHALPVGHRWPRVPGVTLLGDAAHVLPPFAGDGANLAMLDGAELAAAIVGRPGDTEGALTTYEELLFGRAEVAAAESAAHLALCFRPDAPRGLVDLLTSYRELITVGE